MFLMFYFFALQNLSLLLLATSLIEIFEATKHDEDKHLNDESLLPLVWIFTLVSNWGEGEGGALMLDFFGNFELKLNVYTCLQNLVPVPR